VIEFTLVTLVRLVIDRDLRMQSRYQWYGDKFRRHTQRWVRRSLIRDSVKAINQFLRWNVCT